MKIRDVLTNPQLPIVLIIFLNLANILNSQAIIQEQLRGDLVSAENLDFFRAIGVDSLSVYPPPPMDNFDEMVVYCEDMKKKTEAHGLKLQTLAKRCPHAISLGLPERDKKIEQWCNLIKAMGMVGIPIFSYNFKPITIIRTTPQKGRGGALYSSFSYNEYARDPSEKDQPLKIPEEQLWENLQYLLRHIVPAAEQAGVRLALHPDDPPIAEPFGGYPRIVSSIENYEKIFQLAPSPAHGMLFCQGCVTEMGGDVYETIRRMGRQNKIVCVHFRNVRGTPHDFQEVFVDEGNVDMFEAMRAYRDIGFKGPFMMDHTPQIPNDRLDREGRAFAVGFMWALIQAVYR